MKVVAAGNATPDQLWKFQAYLDDLTAVVTEQEARREVKADKITSQSKQEELSAENAVESVRMPTNGTSNGQMEILGSGSASDVEVLEVDDETRARFTDPTIRKRASGVADLGTTPASGTKRKSTRIQKRRHMIQSCIAHAGTKSLGTYDITNSAPHDSDSKPDTAKDMEQDLSDVDPIYKEDLLDLKQWQKSQATPAANQPRTLPKQKKTAKASHKAGQRRVGQTAGRTCRICKSTTGL